LTEEFLITLEKARVRDEAREKLLEVIAVAKAAGDAEEEDGAGTAALLAFGDADEYLEDASPGYRLLRQNKEVDFPSALQTLVIAADGAVTIDTDEWSRDYELEELAAVLSDFLEAGAVLYAEESEDGNYTEAFEITGRGEAKPLRLAWVREDDSLAFALK
jgi:hypothetical protein